MANTITGDRYWNLDTGAVIVACGTPVIVRKIVFYPAAVSDDVLIQDYSTSAVLQTAIRIKAGPTDASLVSLDFGPEGRLLNGFKLATIDGGSVDIYIGKN